MIPDSKKTGLYCPEFEKASCGFGLLAQMDDVPSHTLVQRALIALERLTHRGARSADGKSGDGCGLLLKMPRSFLSRVAIEAKIDISERFAAGCIFLNQDPIFADKSRAALEQALKHYGLTAAGWRPVPVNIAACGTEVLASRPCVEQIFVQAPEEMDDERFERQLFFARRMAESLIEGQDPTFYVVTLSMHTIGYKAMVVPDQLSIFYPDLSDSEMESSICIFHQRFSTNTLPQWRLAQPFRNLAHNGEINTIRANRNWSQARIHKFRSTLLPDIQAIQPLVSSTGSDSCSLDNMLEVLLFGGMDVFRAMRLLTPPAWQNVETMDADLRAFYEYHSMHMEPWDGPAGIVLTDGRYACCVLDRNGLRPARYAITRNRLMILASEAGVLDIAPEDVVTKGRVRPGEMIAVDTASGVVLYPPDVDSRLKSRFPYKKWLRNRTRHLGASEPSLGREQYPREELNICEKMFNVSFEEKDQILRVLAELGLEAIGSMGDDTPLPLLSSQIRNLTDYFRQQFAQVTNPPIDPLREQIVMSLEVCLGAERNVFIETAGNASRLLVDSPVISTTQFRQLLSLTDPRYSVTILDLNCPDDQSLQEAIKALCIKAQDAISRGKVVLVLSDRKLRRDYMTIPALMATGAVHHHLCREGLRCDANLVVETGSVRDSHQAAVFLGYGATAVYPYLAYALLANMQEHGGDAYADLNQIIGAYRKGINKGLYKILSKMGISTINSYRGSQLFEIVGMHDEIVDLCFSGSVSRIQGITFDNVQQNMRILANAAWNPCKPIVQGGLLKFVYGGERHAFDPDVIATLQKAVRGGNKEDYQSFCRLVNEREPLVLRDLLRLKNPDPVSSEQVEPVESILKRFDSAGMSLGALSIEAHEALAIAMNRLGGRSNSGEGGEDPSRYGTERMSRIKQVASGRFGVTAPYLVNADVLQIKVAQGAKPGEGGQLPGHKVNSMIARLRFSKPGVALISPPPHHDIYSIEDLAQLIFDLKQINPRALVSVKLVSEPGIGTIAAGVVKAYADLITISGYDGGTGASPITSIKHAGSPWELGLAETHQVLMANNLRNRVRLQVDGGLKTGLDVIKGAILGAESFGFGTAPMVALGCKYLRVCHLNNCATGIATQNDILRQRHFHGLPEMVMNYFYFVAEETRQWLAHLGMTTLESVVGRTDLLEILPPGDDRFRGIDLSRLLYQQDLKKPQHCTSDRNPPFDKGELAETMVQDMLPAIESRSGGHFSYEIRNHNRTIGARVSGEIAQRYGLTGLEQNPLEVSFTGSAGQSFGAWNVKGLNLTLEGEANDYVGKGMSGGRIVIFPPKVSRFNSKDQVIIGNTCLYGATGGVLYAAGLAGERFAVRNSDAHAVVEGVGDHGCEYMTGGIVTVIGSTGLNFGAGMTGGFAYVLDMERVFVDRYNHELIDIHRISTEHMAEHSRLLLNILQDYQKATNSSWAQEIVDYFSDFVGKFWLAKPKATDLNELLDTLRRAA